MKRADWLATLWALVVIVIYMLFWLSAHDVQNRPPDPSRFIVSVAPSPEPTEFNALYTFQPPHCKEGGTRMSVRRQPSNAITVVVFCDAPTPTGATVVIDEVHDK